MKTKAPFHPALLGCAVIVLLLAYLPALRGGFVWDDDSYVTQNLALRDLGGLGRIWFQIDATPQYYPLVFTGFWIEYRLWGANPLGYHAVNVLLHAVSALLLWRIALRLDVPGAWLAAMIFALHPVHVESVAWITERKNVMSAVFYLCTALAYLRFLGPGGSRDGGPSRWRWYGASLLFFACALLSKSVTCSFPAAMLLVTWWKKGKVKRTDVLRLTPFVVIGIAAGLVTAWIEKSHVGAEGADWSLSLADRFLIAGRALWFYAGKLLYPVRLSFMYPRWQVDSSEWWQWSFPVAAAGVVVALWLARRRLGRGPLAAVLFFAGTLGPALGFIDVYPMRFSFVADHFQYLASIGLIVLGASWLSQRVRVVPVALIMVLGVLTWQQAGHYENLETLLRDTLDKTPTSWMAHNNLGMILRDQGKFQEAEGHYREALRLKPDEATIHYNLAIVLADTGRVGEAISRYEEAIRLRPNHPSSYNNLGAQLLAANQPERAEARFREALQLKPDSAIYHSNLADALLAQNKRSEAIKEYNEALRLDPTCAPAKAHLGALGLSPGR